MTDFDHRFFFDFTDPISYLVAKELDSVDGGRDGSPAWVPFELQPPPTPLTSWDDPALVDRWREGEERAEESGLSLNAPTLVPWTRKAHELCLHAAESGSAGELRMLLFDAYFVDGRDIGRVDVLVELARGTGLDPTETKAVLDVDRFEPDVTALRAEAESLGVTTVPTLVGAQSRLEGFQNRNALATFLRT